MGREYRHGNTKVVILGGDPLPGFPESEKAAWDWIDAANTGKDSDCEPVWWFDCGFKLDFDGPIISVSSRFYPPTKHYGSGWDGSVTILFFDKEIERHEIKAETLDQLKGKAESVVEAFAQKLKIGDK